MSLWIPFNPNPLSLNTTDCTVRALSAALDLDWDTAYDLLVTNAGNMAVMPDSKLVIWSVLRMKGFRRRFVRDDCDFCYTVEDFAREYPVGTYVLCCDDHVVTVKDGMIWDAWDSSREIPIYYWYRKDGRK